VDGKSVRLNGLAVLDGANECSDHHSGIEHDDVAEVLYAYLEEGDYAESHGAAILKLKDGTYAAVEQWEDTTGHGCQCGGEASRHDTLMEACTIGLSEEQCRKMDCLDQRSAGKWDKYVEKLEGKQ
jgi:hypothetical protein